MNDLLKKICVFVHCRQQAAVAVAFVCVTVLVLTSHFLSISALSLPSFSEYNLRYPLDSDSPVDLSLHYVRFDSMYDNIGIESTGSAITYSSNSGGRTAYLYPNSLYQYFSNQHWHIAIRADAAQPKLTARSTYTVSIPNDLISGSGLYWEGFSDWQIQTPDPFGDAAYVPESLQTVSVSDLEANDVRVYYPTAGGSLNIDNGYLPAVEMHSCTDSEQTVDLSSYVGLEYDTLASIVQTVDIQQTELSAFIDSIYGASTDNVFTHCIQVVFGEGSLVHSDTIGSYENGPQYNLELLKYENLVGAGEIVNIMTDNRYTFEFDFNQTISTGSPETVDKYARLYDADGGLLDSLLVSSSGDAVIGNSTNTSDDETNDALFVTFGTELTPNTQYYVTLDEQAVITGWDYVRTALDLDDYRITTANDNDIPVVVSKNPAFGSVAIATSTQDITLVFDEPIFASTSVQTFRISNGVSTSTVVASSVGQYDSITGDTLTIEIDEIVNQAFSTTTGLAAETTYTLEVPQHIVYDDVDSYMDGPAYFVFTTVDNFEEPVPDDDDEEIPVEEHGSRPSSGRRSRQGEVGGSVAGNSGINNSSSDGSLSEKTDVGNGEIPTFRDLYFGATGTDVLELQQALNRIGFTVNEIGAGSVGQETEYFGTSTRAAVTRFQIIFGIMPNVGYFGPITRTLLGFILGR